MRFLFLVLLFMSSIFGANLNIIAPKNSAFIVKKIIKSFHKQYPKIKINFTTSSAHSIVSNIKNGQLIDIAISDNPVHFHQLKKEGFLEGEQSIFAKDTLVIFSLKKLLGRKSLNTLTHNSIENIALLNPFENTQGELAIQALKEANFYKQAKRKFIYANSLEKLLSYALHVTDIGIGTNSMLLLPKFQKYQKRLDFFTLPWQIKLTATLVKRYKPNKNAYTFLQFLTSKKVQNILKNSGYTF